MLPPGEKIVETKKCRMSGQEFFVTDKDLEFYDKVSPVFGGKKYSIPSPTLCPEERQKNRIIFRKETNLYMRKCSLSSRDIISVYSPETPFPVYGNNEWWSDDWDVPYRDFSFDNSFFDQSQKLKNVTPHIASTLKNCINCEYSNIAT
jgi:hypothetical protein